MKTKKKKAFHRQNRAVRRQIARKKAAEYKDKLLELMIKYGQGSIREIIPTPFRQKARDHEHIVIVQEENKTAHFVLTGKAIKYLECC